MHSRRLISKCLGFQSQFSRITTCFRLLSRDTGNSSGEKTIPPPKSVKMEEKLMLPVLSDTVRQRAYAENRNAAKRNALRVHEMERAYSIPHTDEYPIDITRVIEDTRPNVQRPRAEAGELQRIQDVARAEFVERQRQARINQARVADDLGSPTKAPEPYPPTYSSERPVSDLDRVRLSKQKAKEEEEQQYRRKLEEARREVFSERRELHEKMQHEFNGGVLD